MSLATSNFGKIQLFLCVQAPTFFWGENPLLMALMTSVTRGKGIK